MENSVERLVRRKEKLREPQEYKVIFLNDDYTPMDFVVELLVQVFYKTTAEAERMMLDVHENGSTVAGIYTYDIANTKTTQVHELAARNCYPLKCIIERA